MRLPTEPEYQQLYSTYHTPNNVREHMHVVASLAEQLASALTERETAINIPLVIAAARLHDLVRLKDQWQYLPTSISVPQSHAEINYQILRSEFPEVADVVRDHSLMTIFEPNRLNTWEQKIVFYADKRVNHNSIVTLEERIQLGKERWGVTPNLDQTTKVLNALQALEHELFNAITLQPEDLHANDLHTT